MPARATPLVPEQIYHVYNRGVAKQPIFSSAKHYLRFLDLIDYYHFTDTPLSFSMLKKLPSEERIRILDELRKNGKLHVEIMSFCLMPNHFHFLLKQISSHGIKTFSANMQNSYAKYYNVKTDRSGPLFQPKFKAIRIENDKQLLHVSRYIHLNPSTSYLVEIDKLPEYSWSSLPTFLNQDPDFSYFTSCELILGLIKGVKKYKEFALDQAGYQRELDRIKHLTLE